MGKMSKDESTHATKEDYPANISRPIEASMRY